MSLWTHKDAEAATLGRASAPFAASGVSIDTRSLKPGDLFVALKGDNHDGHGFVRAAFAAGAAAALVAEDAAEVGAQSGPLLRVAHTQRGLEDLARAARQRAAAKIVGVTGSAGKTTTKEILRLACGALGGTHASAASHNNHWGVPLSLAGLPPDAAFGVFELGMNHFGELRTLTGFVRPHVALVTTVAPAHLEFFGSVAAIADAKSEIFEGLDLCGAALIPADNDHAARLIARARQAGCEHIVTFGQTGQARLLSFAPEGPGMRVKADILGVAVDFAVGAPGAHIAANVTGALAAVALLGGDVKVAAAALADFAPLRGRGARFQAGGLEVIDESYNANPASMAAALALLGQARGRKIAVLGAMLEMGEGGAAHHAALIEPLCASKTDLVFAVGPEMLALWRQVPAPMRGGFAETSREMVPLLEKVLKRGDTVLVKGSHGAKMAVVIDALAARASGARER